MPVGAAIFVTDFTTKVAVIVTWFPLICVDYFTLSKDLFALRINLLFIPRVFNNERIYFLWTESSRLDSDLFYLFCRILSSFHVLFFWWLILINFTLFIDKKYMYLYVSINTFIFGNVVGFFGWEKSSFMLSILLWRSFFLIVLVRYLFFVHYYTGVLVLQVLKPRIFYLIFFYTGVYVKEVQGFV